MNGERRREKGREALYACGSKIGFGAFKLPLTFVARYLSMSLCPLGTARLECSPPNTVHSFGQRKKREIPH